jgi:hypothetical protein
MSMRFLFIPLPVACLLAACATAPPPPPGTELVDHDVRIEAPGGSVTMLHFNGDGSVVGDAGGGLRANGRWSATGGQICFDWPSRPRDCWPYSQPLRPGLTVTLSGADGGSAQVTLQP